MELGDLQVTLTAFTAISRRIVDRGEMLIADPSEGEDPKFFRFDCQHLLTFDSRKGLFPPGYHNPQTQTLGLRP